MIVLQINAGKKELLCPVKTSQSDWQYK